MDAKSIITSKTFWFNALTVLVTVASVFGYSSDPALAQRVIDIMVVITPIINIVLRLVTRQPVTIP
jgi:hypothetical protein